jgi:hypothetical protein
MPDYLNRRHLCIFVTCAALAIVAGACASQTVRDADQKPTVAGGRGLTARQDEQAGTISVFRDGARQRCSRKTPGRTSDRICIRLLRLTGRVC